MSWIDKIKTDLTITCGDGKTYTPNWINASKSVEYNIASFEFKALAGTLVYRGTPRGARYQLTLFFQGEDHLDLASDFMESANNSKPWVISHPFYETITVQPAGLTVDNTELNISAISGLVIETIGEDQASATNVSQLDRIAEEKEVADNLLNGTFASEVPVINAVDTSSLSNNVSDIYSSVSKKNN